MPDTTRRILEQLNARKREYEELDQFGLYPSGNKVTDKPEILFARLDVKEVMAEVEKIQEAQRAAAAPGRRKTGERGHPSGSKTGNYL